MSTPSRLPTLPAVAPRLARPPAEPTRLGAGLRLKINLIVCALTGLFIAVLLAIEIDSMQHSVNEEVVAANRVAHQLLNRTAWGYAAQGPRVMLAYLEGMGRVRSNDITLLDAEGHELYRSPPSTYKAGREAPGWFESLISPRPSVQSIQFPNGTLIVRANASRAVLDAWDDFVKLAGISLALLVALNGGVFWLVGRTVRPFSQIVHGLNRLEAGDFDTRLPPLHGSEAAAIGAAFNRMAGVLRETLENERRAAVAERQLSDNRELARWVDHQVEQERRVIARELHDELGQSVTAIRSMALAIARRVHASDAESERAARLIAQESSRLYDAMHGLIPRLAPLVLDQFGLAAALEELAERTRASQPQVQLVLDLQLADARPAGDLALTLYRAAQEGLTNALRHGQPRSVRLGLVQAGGELVLEVVDDGRGLGGAGAAAPGHYGLRWLTERVEALGGRLELADVQPHGVRLVVHVPWPVAGGAA